MLPNLIGTMFQLLVTDIHQTISLLIAHLIASLLYDFNTFSNHLVVKEMSLSCMIATEKCTITAKTMKNFYQIKKLIR
jgi:hypothetical protein